MILELVEPIQKIFLFGHTAILSNSDVVAPNSSSSRSGPPRLGAHTQCVSLPRSIPATLGRTTGSPSASTSLSGLLVVSRFLAILLSAFRTRQPRSADTRILV